MTITSPPRPSGSGISLADRAEAMVHADGRLVFQGVVYRCAIGHGGVRTDKQEGDGATPTGVLPLRRVFYRADRVAIPICVVPREPLGPEDGWCDDLTNRAYNQRVRLPYSGRHEELWRADAVSLSQISRAEYSVNGGEWTLIEPTTRITDAKEHAYAIAFEKGPVSEQTIAVRVSDQFDNQSVEKTLLR